VDYIKKPRIQHIVIGIGLLVLSFLLYRQTLGVGFLSDDWHAISIVKDTKNIFQFFATNIVGNRVGSSYGPLWNVALFLEYHMFHLQSLGYHIISIVAMAAAAFSLYGFVRRMSGSLLIGCAAGVLFICLPSHVEAVAWISSQPHLIATALYSAALYCYSVFSSQKKVKYYIAACVLIACSLLTKEIGISFIFIFFLIDCRFQTISFKKEKYKQSLLHVLIYYLPLVVVLGGYMAVRRYTTGVVVGYYGSQSLIFSLKEMIEMATRITVGLFASYPLRDSMVVEIMSHIRLVGTCLVASFVGILWLCRKQMYTILVIGLCYIASLLPYLTLHYNALSNEGERYTYLPSLFGVFGIAYTLYHMLKRVRAGKILYVLVISIISIACIFPIQGKTAEWMKAGLIVQETLPTIQNLSLDPNKPVVLVGLPDRIEGAQLFRNGTLLALELLGYGKFNGDRVLIAPLLSESYSKEKKLVAIDTCGRALCMSSEEGRERLFTGLPAVEMYDMAFILEDFRKTDHTGTRIRIEGKTTDVQMVYFNHNAFQLFAE